MNQQELAQAVKARGGSLSQGQISSLEAGTVTRPRALPELAAALRTTVEWLVAGENAAPEAQQFKSEHAILHNPQGAPIVTSSEPLIVWRSVPNPSRAGETLIYKEQAGVATRPVELAYSKDAFAVAVVDDDSEPRYERRATLLVNPSSTPAAGDDCLFVRNASDNPMTTLTRRLLRITPEHWVVRRFETGSREQKLDRSEWRWAWHIFGSYNRR